MNAVVEVFASDLIFAHANLSEFKVTYAEQGELPAELLGSKSATFGDQPGSGVKKVVSIRAGHLFVLG
jgi:hypothetical protein